MKNKIVFGIQIYAGFCEKLREWNEWELYPKNITYSLLKQFWSDEEVLIVIS